ncbi:MAG: hypothetical protein B7Y11_05900 [Sphingobacteriia bacterium 24-36-13]|nr:MAG: hypothetical protein B7Y11_05900 [Sphingobacteriia bacterium 24-36-13]OZA64851.1 MAG: hypothetical protein B7X68_06045 [Sphingobacteriia bacterium 39-36-14]
MLLLSSSQKFFKKFFVFILAYAYLRKNYISFMQNKGNTIVIKTNTVINMIAIVIIIITALQGGGLN